MAETFTRVEPLWFRYAQMASLNFGGQQLAYSFLQWVDEDVARANLVRGRELCGNASDEASFATDAAYPIEQRLRDIDECVKNGYVGMNMHPWMDPAWVKNWRRFISGGDTEDVIRSSLYSETVQSPVWIAGTPVENRNSDLNSEEDTICPSGRWVSSNPDRTGWCDSYGDGRVVRKRGYGREWMRGIRRGEWAQRLLGLYRQHATGDNDRNQRQISMFAPSPWFWFRSMGMADQTLSPWANGTSPTHVHALDGRQTWRKVIASDFFNGSLATQWSYQHDWPAIQNIIAVAPPAIWWLEFYRAFLDQVNSESVLARITTIRRYVAERNAAVATNNFMTPAGMTEAAFASFARSAAAENASDPTVQAIAGATTGGTGAVASVLGAMNRVSAAVPIVGAAVGAVGMIVGSIASLVDKVTLKDDQTDDERVDEMGRVKPVVLPNSIWFRTLLDPSIPEAAPPSAIGRNLTLPVPGWLRPSEFDYYQNMTLLDMSNLSVPSGFARTPKPQRDSFVQNNRTITYPVGNATVISADRGNAQDQARVDGWVNRFRENMANRGVLDQLDAAYRGQVERLAPVVQAEQDRQDGIVRPPADSPAPVSSNTTNPVVACAVTLPSSFASQAEKDAWIAANPNCAMSAASISVRAPWWWWAVGGTVAVTAIGGGILIFAGKKKREKKAMQAKAGEWDYEEYDPRGWRIGR